MLRRARASSSVNIWLPFCRAVRPLYDFLDDLPDMRGTSTPYLPLDRVRLTIGKCANFDAGRGCPYLCSFCTIINVQGRKSRHRTADDVERLVQVGARDGITNFFITDDNFARNRNWEATFDRLSRYARRVWRSGS